LQRKCTGSDLENLPSLFSPFSFLKISHPRPSKLILLLLFLFFRFSYLFFLFLFLFLFFFFFLFVVFNHFTSLKFSFEIISPKRDSSFPYFFFFFFSLFPFFLFSLDFFVALGIFTSLF